MRYYVFFLLCLIMSSCVSLKKKESGGTSESNPSFPEPIGYVNDFASLLTEEQEQDLVAIITMHDQATTDQIGIVTLKSIKPYTDFDKYSVDLFNHWGIGQKDKDNGILISMSKELRKVRITTGYGMEKRVTDEEAKRILDNDILPEFKKGNYYEGLKKGLAAVIEELK